MCRLFLALEGKWTTVFLLRVNGGMVKGKWVFPIVQNTRANRQDEVGEIFLGFVNMATVLCIHGLMLPPLLLVELLLVIEPVAPEAEGEDRRQMKVD